MSDPVPLDRVVVAAEPAVDGTREVAWLLTLRCSHFAYAPAAFRDGRPSKLETPYVPKPEELFPPPKKMGCALCARAAAGLPPKYDPHLPPELAASLAEHGAKLTSTSTPGSVAASVPRELSAFVGMDGSTVSECPHCDVSSIIDCRACEGTGVFPPVLPAQLASDHVLGFWFNCDSLADAFVVIVRRGHGWVGLCRERRHADGRWIAGIFRPDPKLSAENVIDWYNLRTTDHLDDASKIHFGERPFSLRSEVVSSDPSRIAKKWETFSALVRPHVALPELR